MIPVHLIAYIHLLLSMFRSENAAAAYALARLRRPRVTTEEGLQEYERLLRVS